jgi:hypothetical protein
MKGERNNEKLDTWREMSKECGRKKGSRHRCIRGEGMGEGKKWFSVMFVGWCANSVEIIIFQESTLKKSPLGGITAHSPYTRTFTEEQQLEVDRCYEYMWLIEIVFWMWPLTLYQHTFVLWFILLYILFTFLLTGVCDIHMPGGELVGTIITALKSVKYITFFQFYNISLLSVLFWINNLHMSRMIHDIQTVR